MPATLRQLKRNYKLALAAGDALPLFDLPQALPLSTGTPLFDAALLEKVAVTTTMNEAEHLSRLWKLVRASDETQRAALADSARGLLNDAKLLLALHCWEIGEDERTRAFLRALPWHWRLAFPTAVLKPAAFVFTGWRADLRFRLIDEPRFGALHELFRELLTVAPPVALLKYRAKVKEAAALLHYRFEGERERAIHDWCFGDGRAAQSSGLLGPIGRFVAARDALKADGARGLLDALGEDAIPLTSLMGLLGGEGLRLTDSTPEAPALRDAALRCATATECLLRLAEWGPWLTDAQAQAVGRTVRAGIESGLEIPLFKILKAFLAVPTAVKKRVLEPLLLPLLARYGEQTAALLPPPGPVTFVQPANVLHLTSFLLYATLASAAPTRLVLFSKNRVHEAEPIPLEEVGAHLADSEGELERWLLARFGGVSTHLSYEYDSARIAARLGKLDPAAPLVLDLPFFSDFEILDALLPFERVFNLATAFGAPGEVCVAPTYYAQLHIATRGWEYGFWSRNSDSAAQRLAELLDRLRTFQALAEVPR